MFNPDEIDLRYERVDYTHDRLNKQRAGNDPHILFNEWIQDAIDRRDSMADLLEPNAMVLSTYDPKTGFPDSRTVLLKEHKNSKFRFFGNYSSKKGIDLHETGKAALNFTWLALQRQVRIQGTVRKLRSEESDAYFALRPRGSKIGAWASAQSDDVASYAELRAQYERAEKRFEGENVPRPPHWGGWELTPVRFEFWQGGSSRQHDRIVFTPATSDGGWNIKRLAP